MTARKYPQWPLNLKSQRVTSARVLQVSMVSVRQTGQNLNSKAINTSSLNILVNEIDRNSLENLNPNEAPRATSAQQTPSCVVVNEPWPRDFKYPVFRLDPSEIKDFSDPNYYLCQREINHVVTVLFQEMIKIIK